VAAFLRLAAIIPLPSVRTGVINRHARRTSMKAASTRKQQRPTTPGFAIVIKDDTELGLATLIVESEEGQYQPIGVVASIDEAREIAQSDLRMRMKELERGGDPGICPYSYKVWAQGLEGTYRIAAEILATSL
jgi:hypothetical protein